MHPGPRTTRIIQVENSAHIFLSCHWQVGRYLVTAETGLFVWNLGYVSTEELLQSFAFLHGWQGSCHPFVLYLIPSFCNCPRFIFEIYPAEWNTFNTNPNCPSWLLFLQDDPAHLLPDILICRAFYEGRIYFTLAVVDYRTNYWFWSTEGVSLWWAAPTPCQSLSGRRKNISFSSVFYCVQNSDRTMVLMDLSVLTLANTPLHSQIIICTFFRPSDILALRMVRHQSIWTMDLPPWPSLSPSPLWLRRYPELLQW